MVVVTVLTNLVAVLTMEFNYFCLTVYMEEEEGQGGGKRDWRGGDNCSR